MCLYRPYYMLFGVAIERSSALERGWNGRHTVQGRLGDGVVKVVISHER